MEILIIFFIIWVTIGALLLGRGGGHKPSRGGPVVMRGDNGIESHYDFLEMHGFITPEERKAQRDLEEDFKKNPQNYKVMTWEEFTKEMKDKKD